MIKSLGEMIPKIHESVFVAENAAVVGEVEILEGASIWYGACIRSDMDKTYIGRNTNVQENTTIHNDYNHTTKIGDNVTIGHNCIIHGCTISDNVLVGMGTTILNGAVIGKNTIIGAGSLVTQYKEFEEGVLLLGSPAKVIRKLTEEEINSIETSANHYKELTKLHK